VFLATRCFAEALPLTTKDVGLMLRTGYSSEVIIHELETRHFADTLDDAKQKSLVQSGAKPALLEALGSGRFAVSAEQSLRVKQKLADEAARKAAAAEESRKMDALYQAQRARDRTFHTQLPASNGPIHAALKGQLVRSQNGDLIRVDDDLVSRKKIFGLYFSAHWCAPCRQFTPKLVEFYKQIAAAHPEFEIVFISGDHSAEAMQLYMRDAGMPWPAVAFDRVMTNEVLRKYAGPGLPDLVIVDGSGKILSDSYVNGEYVGPTRVLADLDAMFTKSTAQVLAHR